MMKALCLLAVLLGAAWTAAASTIVTVNWKASDDNGFGLADGTPLANGNELRLGTFDFTGDVDASIRSFTDVGDYAGLAAHFTAFDTAFIGVSAGASLSEVPFENRAGLFEKSAGPLEVATGSALFGQQIFLWVFKTIDNTAVSENYNNVKEVGIFSSDTAAWLFPTDTNNGVPGSTSIEITNLSNAANDALLGTARIVVGDFGLANSFLATGDHHVFRLAPVPEPGPALLFTIATLPFLVRRRCRWFAS